ncbi:Uncharacterized protein GNX_2845 [Leptospira interrogans serovar Canicola]|nr:Uncharacterized protein GNX_2845 [Leptospira interrogans serovar Canicola]
MTIAASPVSEELKQIKSSEYNKIIKILSPKAAPAWSDKAIYKTTLIKTFSTESRDGKLRFARFRQKTVIDKGLSVPKQKRTKSATFF